MTFVAWKKSRGEKVVEEEAGEREKKKSAGTEDIFRKRVKRVLGKVRWMESK